MSDYIVRATAADGQIRAFAANTKDVVETRGRSPAGGGQLFADIPPGGRGGAFPDRQQHLLLGGREWFQSV